MFNQKLIAYGALAAIVLGFSYGQLQYQRGHSAAEHERTIADMSQYKKAADGLLQASQNAQAALDGIETTRTGFIEDYQNAMLNAFDCYADDNRMRSIRNLYPTTITGQSD